MRDLIKNIWESTKKFIIDKAVATLLTTLAISVGGHIWGVHKLNETQKKVDVQTHKVDSLKANCKH